MPMARVPFRARCAHAPRLIDYSRVASIQVRTVDQAAKNHLAPNIAGSIFTPRCVVRKQVTCPGSRLIDCSHDAFCDGLEVLERRARGGDRQVG